MASCRITIRSSVGEWWVEVVTVWRSIFILELHQRMGRRSHQPIGIRCYLSNSSIWDVSHRISMKCDRRKGKETWRNKHNYLSSILPLPFKDYCVVKDSKASTLVWHQASAKGKVGADSVVAPGAWHNTGCKATGIIGRFSFFTLCHCILISHRIYVWYIYLHLP